MHSRRWIPFLFAIAAIATAGWTFVNNLRIGSDMTHAAEEFLGKLDDAQMAKVVHDYDAESRLNWHFIPMNQRKGLQIREMTGDQRLAAHHLLRSGLSQVGYNKAATIMELEHVLHQLEGGRGGNIRDTQRYYFSVFGKPAEGRWGLSVEGHHLSLNFVVEDGRVVSSTPAFFAANPAVVKSQVPNGKPVGTQVLKQEEELAFQLINSLSDAQRKQAIIAEKAPNEIRGPADPQPPQEEMVGISLEDLEGEQRRKVRALVNSYLQNLPEESSTAKMAEIQEAGPGNVHFAWAGALEPGIGHYYRIQGPTFLIEFVNTQPDPSGNPANHIHSVLRDMRGDFAIPLSE